MTDKPHPTDAMEMPLGDVLVVDGMSISKAHSDDQLRAFAIKAYDLGRQEALEDAAKTARGIAGIRVADAIRRMKHGQQ